MTDEVGFDTWAYPSRLGSVTANTDGAGALANSYAWDAWGENVGVSGATYQPLMYTGTYQDHETGIYQMGARWYGAAQGRFTQMDPLPSSVMEANRYEYANSSPCNFTDPTGLMPQPCFEAGLGVATALLNYLPLGFLYEGAVKQGLLWAFERMWWVDAGHEAAEESDPTDLFFQAASVKIGWIPGIGQHLAAVMDILGTIPDWVKCHKILTSS